MRKALPLIVLVLTALVATLFTGCSANSGQKLFAMHCSGCHPNGSNTIHPSKTLKAAALQANMITSPEDIVDKMRNPGPGMPRFTEVMIPNNQAMKIARYVMNTFH
ncbi:MAG: c-type cytochrome [Geobacteraceae bacterium]